MNLMDYQIIILEGFKNRKQYLDDHFMGACLEAKKKHISNKEFFQQLIKANTFFKDEIEAKYGEKLNQYYLAKDQYESENKPFNASEPTVDQYSFLLPDHFRGLGIYGQLHWEDIGHIFKGIQGAIAKILERGNIMLPARGSTHKPLTNASINSLKELFIDETDFKKAISALKKIKVIDKNNSNLLGGSLKGVMQVWVRILRTDRQQIKAIHDKDLTILLNKYFANLNLSEKTDGKHFRNSINKKASDLYRAHLLALM